MSLNVKIYWVGFVVFMFFFELVGVLVDFGSSWVWSLFRGGYFLFCFLRSGENLREVFV